MARNVLCSGCVKVTKQKVVQKVGFFTKWRNLTVTSYQCLTCNSINVKQNNKWNKNPQIWD